MISAKPLKGGALSVVVADDKLHLLYMHEDKSMHYVVCHDGNLEWVGAEGLARRCSREQETIYTRMEYIHGDCGPTA
jgi:hypothetical protein